jgi:hypothetical protein
LATQAIAVKNVTFHSTQPWPFPGSLMIGAFAQATNTDIRTDLDNELEGKSRSFSLFTPLRADVPFTLRRSLGFPRSCARRALEREADDADPRRISRDARKIRHRRVERTRLGRGKANPSASQDCERASISFSLTVLCADFFKKRQLLTRSLLPGRTANFKWSTRDSRCRPAVGTCCREVIYI